MDMNVAFIEGFQTVELCGRLDAVVAASLREQLSELASGVEPNVAVDLRRVPFVDSAGLAALVRGKRATEALGGSFRIVGPLMNSARRIFELTCFDQVFDIIDGGDHR